MTKKKLEKKLIVTANLDGLNEQKFGLKISGMATAAKDHPDYVPGLNPVPDDVLNKTKDRHQLLVKRDNLIAEQKQVTQLIYDADEELKEIIIDKWAPQIQTAAGITEAKVLELEFGIKGIDDGHTDDVVSKACETHPLIKKIDVNIHLQHSVYTVNSQSGNNKLPDDAKQIDIYEQIGGETLPNNIKKMTYAGMAKRGKFINHFDSADLGKTVYYIAVYVDKKTLKPLEQSPVTSALIN